MIKKYDFNTKFLKVRARRKPAQVFDSNRYPVFAMNKSLKRGVAQMGIFSNQTDFDAIYQLCSTSSLFPLILPLRPNIM